jgi:hypothetical protein
LLVYPGELEQIAEVQRKLAGQFDLADRVYDFWLMQEKDVWLAKSNMPYPSSMLAMMVNVQACRKFRTVVELCRRSEAFRIGPEAVGLVQPVLDVQRRPQAIRAQMAYPDLFSRAATTAA